MSARKVSMMTEDELVHVIRMAVRAEFSAAGMRRHRDLSKAVSALGAGK
jgi:hypothetical protein